MSCNIIHTSTGWGPVIRSRAGAEWWWWMGLDGITGEHCECGTFIFKGNGGNVKLWLDEFLNEDLCWTVNSTWVEAKIR